MAIPFIINGNQYQSVAGNGHNNKKGIRKATAVDNANLRKG